MKVLMFVRCGAVNGNMDTHFTPSEYIIQKWNLFPHCNIFNQNELTLITTCVNFHNDFRINRVFDLLKLHLGRSDASVCPRFVIFPHLHYYIWLRITVGYCVSVCINCVPDVFFPPVRGWLICLLAFTFINRFKIILFNFLINCNKQIGVLLNNSRNLKLTGCSATSFFFSLNLNFSVASFSSSTILKWSCKCLVWLSDKLMKSEAIRSNKLLFFQIV